MSETLSTLFAQRSKTLQSSLSWHQSSDAIEHAEEQSTVSTREVTQAMKNVLNTISLTVTTVRTLFQDSNSRPCLIIRVLETIQADSFGSDVQSNDLPSDLLLSTKSLLTQLTSSANFQLLPPNLRTYKPYIDLDSSSASLSKPDFSRRLQDWFHISCKQWREASEKWLSGLQSVKDIWSLRASLRRCISGSGLEEVQKDHIYIALDELCHARITMVWQRTLSAAEKQFKDSLRENVLSSERQKPLGLVTSIIQMHLVLINIADMSPETFLFQPPPIPVLSQTVKSFVDTPFQRYQLSLKKQLVNRSSRLDSVISTLEQCAKTIQLDFSQLKANTNGKSTFVALLMFQTCHSRLLTEHSCNGSKEVMSPLQPSYRRRL